MKIFGILLIISASVFTSIYYEKKQRENIFLIENVINFVSYIKVQISVFTLPLDSIYEKYKNQDASMGEIIRGNYSSLKRLEEKIRTEIINFFRNIGKGFKEQQLIACELLISNLSNELTTQKNEAKNKIKIFRAISLFVSVCIIIFIV